MNRSFKTIFILLMLVFQLRTMQGKPETELQLGLSYNRLTWKVSNLFFVPDYTSKWNHVNLQPCARFTVHTNVLSRDSIRKVSFSTFVGFHIFGGKLKQDTSSYKDKLAFYAFEAGVYPSYHIHRSFSLGAGFKVNYIARVIQKSFGTLNQDNDDSREWSGSDASDRFVKFSCNPGIVARYKKNRCTIAAEAWFGITNLYDPYIQLASISIKENNYRLLLGYTLGKKK